MDKGKVLTTVILGTVLVLGALGRHGPQVPIIEAVGITLLVILTVILKKRKLLVPSGFFLFILFLGTVAAGTLASPDKKVSLSYLLLFLGGGALWLVAFNLKDKIGKIFENLIIFLGILMAILYSVSLIFGGELYPQSLYTFSSVYKNHNHIGDLWTILLLIISYRLIARKSQVDWTLVLLGIYLVIFSYSRSAVLSLFAGLAYLFGKTDLFKKNKLLFPILVSVSALVFILMGLSKTTIFSRPYFAAAIIGFLQNPLGIGMGNFQTLSLKYPFFSAATHNIILEVLVGLGWIGTIFVIWLALVLWRIFKDEGRRHLIFKAIFLALTVNFFFDSTYAISTMIWVWFLSLGLSYSRIQEKSRL